MPIHSEVQEPIADSDRGQSSELVARLAAGLAVGIALVFAAGLAARSPTLTAPLCWRWPYRGVSLARALACFWPGLALYLAAAALLLRARSRRNVPIALALLVVATLALQLGAVFLDGKGIETLELRVEHSGVTSYFTDAEDIHGVRDWLGGFPPSTLHLHSRTHPPGPILYYWILLSLFPESMAATLGGVGIGLLAAAVVLLLYRFAALWSTDPTERAWCAALWPLSSCVIGFMPEFDQVYPAFTILLLLAWNRALLGSRRHAILTGLLGGAALFFAWNLLFLALPLLLLLLWRTLASPPPAPGRRSVAGALFLSGAALAVLLSALFFGGGYHPLLSFRAAIAAQATFGLEATCPWRSAVLSGPWDLLLTVGVIPLGLWLAELLSALRGGIPRRTADAMTIIGALTLLAVDVSGRLPQETARVWIFLLPFFLPAAGIRIARLSRPWRVATLSAQVVVFFLASARLVFIGLS